MTFYKIENRLEVWGYFQPFSQKTCLKGKDNYHEEVKHISILIYPLRM